MIRKTALALVVSVAALLFATAGRSSCDAPRSTPTVSTSATGLDNPRDCPASRKWQGFGLV